MPATTERRRPLTGGSAYRTKVSTRVGLPRKHAICGLINTVITSSEEVRYRQRSMKADSSVRGSRRSTPSPTGSRLACQRMTESENRRPIGYGRFLSSAHAPRQARLPPRGGEQEETVARGQVGFRERRDTTQGPCRAPDGSSGKLQDVARDRDSRDPSTLSRRRASPCRERSL